jgi:DNA-binding transcriptional LysR family regulator
MDLMHGLTTFVRIVETGSFSAAAREANASHSAVTRLVGQLEDHFGVRLFHRTTRRLSLTEDGRDLLGHARHLIELADEMEVTLGRQRATPTGLVRVGLPVGAATLLVPRLSILLRQHPALSVEMVVRDQFGDLVEERLDVAVGFSHPADSSLIARQIGVFGRVPVAAAAYLERHGAPARPGDLTAHNCIIHETGPDSALWHFDGPDGPEGVRVSGSFRANNSEVLHNAAQAGLGIAMLPEAMVADDLRAVRLYRLLPDHPSRRQPAMILYPSRRHLAPRTRVVIDFLAEQIKLAETRLSEDRMWGASETAWLG